MGAAISRNLGSADYELLFDCVHCGLCLEACPTYAETRAEMDSPRGRIYLMKALAESKMPLDADVARHLDLCLGCRACETACPSGVRYGRLIEGTREFVEQNFRRGWRDRLPRLVANFLFPFPRRLRLALLPVRIIERLGLSSTLRRIAPATVGDWLELLPGKSEDEARTVGAVGSMTHAGESVAIHRGCVASVLADSANQNSARLLSGAGYSVTMLDAPCCGALDLHNGNTKRALRFARANVRLLKRSEIERVVSCASGCSAAIAEYGELLKNDPELASAAAEVAGKVRDLSSLLLKAGFVANHGRESVVVYHDSCHLAHGLGIREQPRQLLRSIPGVKLVEMAESDMCCGSAGSYNLTQPEMARTLAARKVDRIVETRADYVVMANPGCQFQIAAELRRRGATTRAIHIADFIAQAVSSGQELGSKSSMTRSPLRANIR